ncbi:NADP-dependent phosphogluconate dehydrogenase [Maribacter sp. HTCC2170]|uniref:NADP-dependent phosphogluconate dehydrogenase n=1 Tax=Maribacter sp. (strain HTCC2170 / KCCM 42371) TaxID=313603 RepID=UPI00006B47D9|nr:NADP-dependent phosphogluconate dehydrogenase [Maribacter sp. HTCC2170]EAR01610.1 6-phosphogluconate dehydrogenase [Maribacter sp. HTCC2170]
MVEVSYDFGLVGLGVMGRNFILNVADKGFNAFGHDLDETKVKSLIEEGGNVNNVNASSNVTDFVNSLSTPRKIMLLVPAGKIVDSVVESILPHLDSGDILIDGGNSFFTDTDRREEYLKSKEIHFFGTGVSGGAKGARLGPSIMPGGSKEAYKMVQPIFEAVAAKFKGEPCVAYLGPKSAGNYVKMVHNGIEYGLMQLTSEIYDILKKLGGYSNSEIQELFASWNKGRLQSFLVNITADILTKKDEITRADLVDLILDKGKQKGTGKWTSQNAMDLGIPIPSIDIAVTMREISALKKERDTAAEIYSRPNLEQIAKSELAKRAEQSLFFGFIVTYAQGFHQLSEASKEYSYELNLSLIAKIWRAGCIIRASLLEDISSAYEKDSSLSHLLFNDVMAKQIKLTISDVRQTVALGIKNGVPLPGLTNSLTYFDSLTSKRLPMNIIQAQRDYFGSHTYERTDRDGIFHTHWEE